MLENQLLARPKPNLDNCRPKMALELQATNVKVIELDTSVDQVIRGLLTVGVRISKK